MLKDSQATFLYLLGKHSDSNGTQVPEYRNIVLSADGIWDKVF